jgi:hypothetical protein
MKYRCWNWNLSYVLAASQPLKKTDSGQAICILPQSIASELSMAFIDFEKV